MYNIVIMSTVLHVKLDEDLKKEAQETAKNLGLPLSTVVASTLREFVRTQSITFSGTPRLKPDVENELLSRSSDVKKSKNLSPTFSSLDEAKKWLEA